MSYPTLPLGLPACALREGWQVVADDALRRTDMDDGQVAVTRRFHRLRTVHSLSWELNGYQLDLALQFWADDLSAGAAWFHCPIVEGSRTRTQLVRFASSPPFTVTSPAPGVFRVAFEAELRDLPRLTSTERMALEVWASTPEDVADLTARLKALADTLEAIPQWP